jgi:hypothetical protein
LATLTRCELKKGLQDSDRRNTFKNHGKGGSDGFDGWVGGNLGGPSLIFDAEQKKTDQKSAKKACGSLFEGDCRIIQSRISGLKR